MNTATRFRKPLPPATGTVALLGELVLPCDIFPRGFPGEVRINGTEYTLTANLDGERLAGYRLRKADGTVYDIEADDHGQPLSCSCPDATWRAERSALCKHCGSVRKLLSLGKLPRPVCG